MNVTSSILFFIAPEILFSANECMSYFTNQPLLRSLYINWSDVFFVLAFLFTSFDDYHANIACDLSQGNCLLHLSCKEDGSYVQGICKDVKIDLSLLSSN